MASNTITPVWDDNFTQEIDSLALSLDGYKLMSIDTEFPGFLRETPRGSPDDVVYDDLKYNVDKTNLIQLGVTLLDDQGNVGPTWEFNFKFDLDKDTHVESSIDFLKKSGLDFQRMKQDGIHWNLFRLYFLRTVAMRKDLKWVTFHGLYDLAYMLKLFTEKPLPDTAQCFAGTASFYFARVLDLKFAAKHCEGFQDVEVGLARLSRMLNVKRLGEAHNAGSDSLLTAHVYARLRNAGDGELEGVLYGLRDVMIGRVYVPPVYMAAYPMPVQYGLPCAAYAMAFKPRIRVHWRVGNYDVVSIEAEADAEAEPGYYIAMPVPETYVML